MQPDFDNLLAIFEKMHVSGFDANKALKWDFFFINDNKEGLERVFNELKDHGYLIEKLELDDEEWTLQVSKIYVLTAKSCIKGILHLMHWQSILM
jgi:hypothetical protein